MRDLNECKTEVFRRSSERIAERRKMQHRILALCIPLCLVAVISAGSFSFLFSPLKAAKESGENQSQAESLQSDRQMYEGEIAGTPALGSLDSFSFSLTWGCYGISSYDSATGQLVKTTDATHPEDYKTTYQLTEAQKKEIYDLIDGLDVTKYPDAYDPHGEDVHSSPSMTLILSVSTDQIQKTITAEEIAMTYHSDDPAGQEFLDVCKAIEDILTETKAWKALPEYEFYYD